MNINIKFQPNNKKVDTTTIKTEIEKELVKIIKKYPKLVKDASLHVDIDDTKESEIKIKAILEFISRRFEKIIVNASSDSLSKAIHEIHVKCIRQLEKIHNKVLHSK